MIKNLNNSVDIEMLENRLYEELEERTEFWCAKMSIGKACVKVDVCARVKFCGKVGSFKSNIDIRLDGKGLRTFFC